MSLPSAPIPAAPNVDPAELAKFQALAARWWDPESEFRPLHEINPLRLEWIDAHASIAGKRVLDVGCGGGILAEAMAQRGAIVRGIDLGERALQVAELHALESGAAVEYERIAVEMLAQREPDAYDVVTCMELLEHVPDPQSVVRACSALVRPGGWVFFSTINRNAKAFALAVVGAEYVLGLLPRGTHEYEKFIRPSELAAAARRCRLELAELMGLTYNPITRRYRLDPGDPDVNYMMACRRLDALGAIPR
ncbi:MAG: bifunctional 2-polyprenyl-6-hydroxyphenol methylase/3-demethylubiquinol 3-O-methyltransferase UbiG [Burkholderiaceae bacterium]|nr:bifunctional 2-polyprenyl-6-hydroxyphenol methylase/3-demethylubiquinol 3-O-methyltransferase UbiG [Burkholderiaceae bacterium]